MLPYVSRGVCPTLRRIRALHTQRPLDSNDQRWPGWGVVVGIEVHAQIKSKFKLFSGQWRCLIQSTRGHNLIIQKHEYRSPTMLPTPSCLRMTLPFPELYR